MPIIIPFFFRTTTLEQRRKEALDIMCTQQQTEIIVSRHNVDRCLFDMFSNESSPIYSTLPYVEFEGESATDLDGLSRELFSLFWECVRSKYFDGSSEAVPRIDPQTCGGDVFHTMGRILSYGYLATGFFPVFICKVSMMAALGGTSSITDDMILSSFLNYIDGFEVDSTCRLIGGNQREGDNDIIVNMLSRFKCITRPTPENVRGLLIECGRSELICKPAHALNSITCGMLEIHPFLWDCMSQSVGCLTKIYECATPTCESVWHLVQTPPITNAQQDAITDYLRRFIFSLNRQELSLLLRFVTGSSIVSSTKIELSFCTIDGISRSPTAFTCSGTLVLPTTYKSYIEFRQEFNNILQSSQFWYMDNH